MEQFIPYLPFIIAALVCPIAMSALMWYMMRDGHGQMNRGSMLAMTRDEHSFDGVYSERSRTAQDRLAAIKAEKDALEKQIRELETVRALQERRDDLANQSVARASETRS